MGESLVITKTPMGSGGTNGDSTPFDVLALLNATAKDAVRRFMSASRPDGPIMGDSVRGSALDALSVAAQGKGHSVPGGRAVARSIAEAATWKSGFRLNSGRAPRNTRSSTGWSWPKFWVVHCEPTNACITRTASRRTIVQRTLNCGRSAIRCQASESLTLYARTVEVRASCERNSTLLAA